MLICNHGYYLHNTSQPTVVCVLQLFPGVEKNGPLKEQTSQKITLWKAGLLPLIERNEEFRFLTSNSKTLCNWCLHFLLADKS
jgi:hypothetical protein